MMKTKDTLLLAVMILVLGGVASLFGQEAANQTVADTNQTVSQQPAAVSQQSTTVSQPSAAQPEAAQDKGGEDKIAGGMEGFISLNLRDIDIIEALKFLSRKASLNIVTTKAVAGRVTLMVENVLVKDVFDIMLRSNKLAYDKTGQIYNVMTQDEYKALYGKPFFDTREVATFRLKYTIPEQAFSLFDALKSDIGRVLVDPESGQVLIIDIPSKIRDIQTVLEGFEQKNEVRIFPLQYAKAKEVEEQLKNQLDAKKVGLIKADERANQLIVQTLPERMKDIERLIGELDTKTKEVVIETTIIKVNLTNDRIKGFQWEGLFDAGLHKGLLYLGSTPFATVNPQTTAGSFTSRKETFKAEGVGSFPFSGTSSSLSSSVPAVGTESLHLGMVTAQDFDTVLHYIQSLGSSKIIANPKLVVTNNQESRIHVGEKQAYVTTTTTTGQVTSTVAEQVTFVDVGTQLSITPTINDDGYVTMKVKAEISSVAETLITPTQNKIPIIDTSLAETTVMVKEGTTIIIGGLRKDEKTENMKQTPFLSKIPLIGELFKNGTNSVDHSELMIFLTPKIISGDTMVTEAGRNVEQTSLKGAKDYSALKPPVREISVSSVDSSLVDKKVVFKGLRTVE